jgi:hypothetical protein
VACKVSIDHIRRIGVGIEVDDSDIAIAVHVSDSGCGRPCDGVVTAESDGNNPASCDLVNSVPDVGQAAFRVTMGAMSITNINDGEMVKNFEVEIDVVGA